VLKFQAPQDSGLVRLTEDAKLEKCLDAICKKDKQPVEPAKQCIGGLYHHASKFLHGRLRSSPLELCAHDWTPDELRALRAICNRFEIDYNLLNKYGTIKEKIIHKDNK